MSDSIPLFDNYLIAALQSAIKADPNASAGGVVSLRASALSWRWRPAYVPGKNSKTSTTSTSTAAGRMYRRLMRIRIWIFQLSSINAEGISPKAKAIKQGDDMNENQKIELWILINEYAQLCVDKSWDGSRMPEEYTEHRLIAEAKKKIDEFIENV